MTETVPAPGPVEEPPPAVPIGERIAQLTAEYGDAPAVISGDTTRSWTELDRRTNRLARALLARGVVLGDLVTIGLPNSVEFVEACVACWKFGAMPQPVSAAAAAAGAAGRSSSSRTRRWSSPAATSRWTARSPTSTSSIAESRRRRPAARRCLPGLEGAHLGRQHRPAEADRLRAGRRRRAVRVDGAGAPARRRPSLMPGPLYHNGPFTSAMAGLLTGSTWCSCRASTPRACSSWSRSTAPPGSTSCRR